MSGHPRMDAAIVRLRTKFVSGVNLNDIRLVKVSDCMGVASTNHFGNHRFMDEEKIRMGEDV